MDAVYRGFETSLLALSLALGIGAVALSSLPREPALLAAATLPMISVTAGTSAN